MKRLKKSVIAIFLCLDFARETKSFVGGFFHFDHEEIWLYEICPLQFVLELAMDGSPIGHGTSTDNDDVNQMMRPAGRPAVIEDEDGNRRYAIYKGCCILCEHEGYEKLRAKHGDEVNSKPP